MALEAFKAPICLGPHSPLQGWIAGKNIFDRGGIGRGTRLRNLGEVAILNEESNGGLWEQWFIILAQAATLDTGFIIA